jgi:hypothetical protein
MALIAPRIDSFFCVRYWVGGNVISGAAAGAIAEALDCNGNLRKLSLGEHML